MLDYKNFEWEIWNGDLLRGSLIIDTETNVVPFHTRDHKLIMFQAYNGSKAVAVETEDVAFFLEMHKNSVMVFQNAAFDVQVLSHIVGWDYWFKKIDNDTIHDTKLLYQLLVLATTGSVPNRSSLKDICKNLLIRNIDKNVDVRCTFDQYMGKPLSEFSPEHIKYGLLDVIHTHDVYIRLMELIKPHDTMSTLLSHSIQLKGSIALDQIYKNGISVDLDAKLKVMNTIKEESDLLATKLSMWGYVKGKKGNKRAVYDVCEKLGFLDKLPLTEKSKEPATTKDSLIPYMHFSFISDFLRYQELEKAASFITNIETERIHPRYTTILNTGRTSCTGAKSGACNIQQLPRVGGIREIFVPKAGYKFVDVDYSALELATLAENLKAHFGDSHMADLINEGRDLHYETAMNIYGKPKNQITKEERQFAKIANFGYPANMSPVTFIDYCKGYGLKIDIEESTKIKDVWLQTFPEVEQYFDLPRQYIDGTKKYWSEEKGMWEDKNTYCQMTLTGRKRAYCTYTAFLNTAFQGLAADGAKLAMYKVLKSGFTTVAFIHDQLLVEVPEDTAEEALSQVSELMIQGMEEVVKNVKIGVEGDLKSRFSK